MKRRCEWHDYTRRQMYMVTLTTEGRRKLFGEVVGHSEALPGAENAPRMVLSDFGQRVEEEFLGVTRYYPQVEMPLGIRAAKSGSYTFTLPYREAYEEYQHVWLSDHATGTVTDLMADDYTLTVTADDAVATRSGEGDSSQGYGLTLQIGGMRPGITDLNHDSGSYRIGVDHELVKVYGTRDGDTVAIYTAGGALVVRGTASGDMFQQRVTPGVYVVRVNGYSKTVVARQ